MATRTANRKASETMVNALLGPNKNLALSQFQKIAVVPAIGRRQAFLREGKSAAAQVQEKHSQKLGAIRACEFERGQHGRRRLGAQQANRPAAHSRPGSDPRGAEDENRTGEHVEAQPVARASADGDETAAQRMPQLIARVAVDEDFSAG